MAAHARATRALLTIALVLAPIASARAGDYLGTKSSEYGLRGRTVIEVSAKDRHGRSEREAVEKALDDDNRYYNLIHFISAYFTNHGFASFARGYSFKTESFQHLDGDRYEVLFRGEIGGPVDLLERMDARGLLASGHRIVIPFPVDVDGMSEHDWYYWSPSRFHAATVQIPLTIARETPTPDAYPDYKRLFAGGSFTIAIFFGYDGGDPEEGLPGGDDLKVAKEFYQRITDEAKKGHFSDPVDEHFGAIKTSTTFTKTILADGGKGLVPVQVSLKLFYRHSPKVKYHFRKELEDAQLVVYDGHSAYGGGFTLSKNLFFSNPEDTEALDKEMVADRTPVHSQIYFINACHSYGYYADMFYNLLSRKDPSNLDVVTAINPASFADSVKTDVKLISLLTATEPGSARPLHHPFSWQEIVASLNAGLSSQALYGVHGIADNPHRAYGDGGAAPAREDSTFWKKLAHPRGGKAMESLSDAK